MAHAPHSSGALPIGYMLFPNKERSCKTEGCHGTTIEVYCGDCLGDGVDPDPPPDVE